MSKKLVVLLLTLAAGCLAAVSVIAQSEEQAEYRLLATVKGATLEAELNEAAGQGFRFEKEAQAIGLASLSTLLSRPANATPERRYEYKTLNSAQFQKQKPELLAQGFVFRAALNPSVLSWSGSKGLFLFEREVSAGAGQYEYDLIESCNEKKLQTLLDNANSAGFTPIGALSATGSCFIVLQRSLSDPAAEMGKREYCLLNTLKISTLEKEMNEAAQAGFRFAVSSAAQDVLMAREYKAKDQPRFEYKLIPIRAKQEAVQALSEAVKQGFVFRTVTGFGMSAIMERAAGQNAMAEPVEFEVLDTRTEATMQKEIQAAAARGFKPLSLSGGSGRFMTLLARTAPVQEVK